MGVRVKVGFKDSVVGVKSGQNSPQGTFGVHGASPKGDTFGKYLLAGGPGGGGGGQG